MQAQITLLYKSDFCEINNFVCQCTDCTLSRPEYQDKFSICYVRKGNFLFNAFRSTLDPYTGYCLVNKPGYEYRVAHLHNLPDECTIFSFSPAFYELLSESYKNDIGNFFKNPNMQSIVLKCGPEIEFLHWQIFQLTQKRNSSLQIDCLILEMIEKLFSRKDVSATTLPAAAKVNYLTKIENAKQFIHAHFAEDISLSDLTKQAFMSSFHFVRIFKLITNNSPYQYLLKFRLSNAQFLLLNTALPVTDVCYRSGFKNPDHFSTVFKSKFNIHPTAFRNRV